MAGAPPPFQDLSPSGGIVHASAVALGDRGLLIAGPSGSGKSTFALRLMALGARLVADDRVMLTPDAAGGPPVATAPAAIRGLIEARGLGILRAEAAPSARIVAVLDLGLRTTVRLPDARSLTLAGHALPWISLADGPYFAEAMIQYLKGGLAER